MEKKRSFLWALHPLYFYSKFFGLAPVNCQKSGLVSYCIYGYFSNFLLIVVSFAWLIWRLTKVSQDHNNDQVLQHCTEISDTLLVFTTIFSLIYFLFRTKKNILKLINKISAADVLLYGDQTDALYRQNRRFLFYEMIFIVILHMSFFFNKLWFFYDDHPFMLFKYIICFVNTLINLQLINWLILLRQRFCKIQVDLNEKDWHVNELERKFLRFTKRIEVIPKEEFTKKM